MEAANKKYTTFHNNIDKFIDKFYISLLVRGIILFTLLASSIILLVTTVEYLAWFNYSGRLFLLLFTITTSLFILYFFFLTPLFKYLGLFKRITDRKTALIISQQIPELKDYILNVLELNNMSESMEKNDLINAALIQKIDSISYHNFMPVVTFRSSISLLKYIFTILTIYLLLFIFKPAVLLDSSDRILHFNNNYVKNLSYNFTLDTSKLTIEKGSNLDVNVKLTGQGFPSSLSLFIGNKEFLMERFSPDSFALNIQNVNNSFYFRLGSDLHKSKSYLVNVNNPPFLNSFKIIADYPSYTTKVTNIFKGISNLKVPIGTHLQFKFDCNYVDSLFFIIDSLSYPFVKNGQYLEFDLKVLKSIKYSISGENSDISRELVPSSFISSISDLFPQIDIDSKADKYNNKLFYFKGNISDDYGFTKLEFVVNNTRVNVPINSNLTSQDFFFSYEFNDSISQSFNYFFEVFDNDFINGFKGSKSANFEFIFPDFVHLLNKKNSETDEVVKKIEQSLLLAQEFKRDIQDIKKKMVSENLSSYEKKQFINDLQKKQKTLEDILNDFAQQNRQKNNHFNSFSDQDKELLQKQQQIQELLDVVMDEELKNLLQELQDLTNQDNINRDLDKLEMNYENLSEQLDKNLELLKKFEVERDLENISTQLDKLSDDQKMLSKNSESSFFNDSLLKNNIKDIENLKRQFEKVLDNNTDLQNPFKIEDLTNDFEDLKMDLQESTQNNSDSKSTQEKSEKSTKSKFSKNSKKAKQLSDKILQQLNNNSHDESAENAETLRQVLENLFYFSFQQEEIYSDMKRSLSTSPKFASNIRSQSSLKINFSIIKDSLFQLSKRTPYLGNHINKKVFSIESSLFDIEHYIKINNYSKLYLNQRYVIRYSNDLILLLSESLKNMQSSGSGSGSSKSKGKKKKPQKGEPSLSEMRKSQESMKSQLEGMIQDMKDGQGKGGKKNSQQLGKMLSQQEIFQNSLNQLKNSQGIGTEVTKQLNEINKLIDQNKRDIINNNLSNNSVLRQQQIVTRLLQAENAKMERELDDKRESNEAINYIRSNPSKIFNDKQENIIFDDILNNSSIKLNYFFRNKYQEYIKKLN